MQKHFKSNYPCFKCVFLRQAYMIFKKKKEQPVFQFEIPCLMSSMTLAPAKPNRGSIYLLLFYGSLSCKCESIPWEKLARRGHIQICSGLRVTMFENHGLPPKHPYQETGAPPRVFLVRPPYAGHWRKVLNWQLALTTTRIFPTQETILFEPSQRHKELPAPAQTMSRAPHCAPHNLSTESICSQATMPAQM